MSDSIAALTEKLKNAQIELERAAEALLEDVNSDNANGRYNQAILKLDRAEAELEAALAKFKHKKY